MDRDRIYPQQARDRHLQEAANHEAASVSLPYPHQREAARLEAARELDLALFYDALCERRRQE